MRSEVSPSVISVMGCVCWLLRKQFPELLETHARLISQGIHKERVMPDASELGLGACACNWTLSQICRRQ